MKKLLLAILIPALCLVSCKKDERETTAVPATFFGTASSTSVSLPNNQQPGESVAAVMPKSQITGAFKLTEDEFVQAWSDGKITFGACEADDHNNITWGSTLGQGKWGHYFDADGKTCQSESSATVCIEGKDTPFTYVISGEGDFSNLTGKTITCTQVFRYQTDLTTTTVFVPWTVKIEKGDVRILKYCGNMSVYNKPYENALNEQMTTIAYCGIDKVVGFNPADSSAVLIIDGKVDMTTKADTLYVNLDGTAAADSTSAAAVIYKNAKKRWVYRLMPNEVAEGNTLKVNLGFVNEEYNIAAGYTIEGQYKERTFAKIVDSTFTMNTGIAYKIQILSTNRSRTTTFDLPAAAYQALDQMAKARGQNVTLAQLILGKWMLIQGGAEKAECTAEPYGHWFDANSKVCKSDDSKACCGLIHTPDITTGHSPVTLQNVPGSNKVGDKFTCIQFFLSTALGVTIPISFTIEVVESVEEW